MKKEVQQFPWKIADPGSSLIFCRMYLTGSTNPVIRVGWDWVCPLQSIWWKHITAKFGRKVKWAREPEFRSGFRSKGVVKYPLVISARKASFHAPLSCLPETQKI